MLRFDVSVSISTVTEGQGSGSTAAKGALPRPSWGTTSLRINGIQSFSPWRRRRYSLPKLLFLQELHGFIISQKTAFFILPQHVSAYMYLLCRKCSAYVRLEVFTAVTMKNGVFWDVTPWCNIPEDAIPQCCASLGSFLCGPVYVLVFPPLMGRCTCVACVTVTETTPITDG
jgi:hypothetical protein